MRNARLVSLFAMLCAFTACAPAVVTRPAAVRPASVPRNVLVSENNARLSISCDGGDMTISGNRNFVTFTSVCDDIIVTGNSNTVTADSVRRVTVRGNNNRVTWGGNDPVVSNSGNNNTVRRR
ncbi:DUF3060 domain-containing protein [Deinococcus peraridilitoris]|uniref:DUF3060 domain-containing protein n=1 Tax=Deinococcus peraridilitoris (strain DSM 19664 / LMG 22246 / CIP 109416 / KR-200) TaxID=937777 RepID=L0A3C2_DEIPD|nr:DUF3060 domain-containing protein [Deinococcus peraridilitoris]AFZ67510.1 Protein of unknown function (DUF3060) [Deinococcus peraridilitoris DSM 19664]